MLKRLAKELCVYILAGVVIWFCIITISGGESVKLGISEAVDRCMNIIIPSLFVFMALSQILVSSGLYYCVSMPFLSYIEIYNGHTASAFLCIFSWQYRRLSCGSEASFRSVSDKDNIPAYCKDNVLLLLLWRACFLFGYSGSCGVWLYRSRHCSVRIHTSGKFSHCACSRQSYK